MAKSGSLSIRVVEGRALPAKDVSGSSDPYCLVKVDDQVVARTATIWRSLSPFWGEEYTVHLPLDFHHLAFYVLDEDTVGHDDIIGKISLSKEAITADPRGIDSWINLSRVDPDAEVQGEVCLDVKLLEDARGRCLRCHVRQARDLAPRDISGTSDPFARVFWGNHSLETSTIKKTRFPHWDEVLELREAPGTTSPLRVELWDWDMVGKNDFLGMVEFTPQTLQQKPPNGWFRLLPFPRAEDSGGSLGALRLKVRLTEDRVLPSQYYQPLMELLLESVQGPAEEDTTSPLALLEELASGDCRQDLATKLVKLFLGRGLAGPFLDYLTRREVARTNDPNTLFRSNSLASKSMEQFMKPRVFPATLSRSVWPLPSARGHALPARGPEASDQPRLRGEEIYGTGPLQDGPEPLSEDLLQGHAHRGAGTGDQPGAADRIPRVRCGRHRELYRALPTCLALGL